MYNIFDFGQRIYLSIYSSFSINNTSNKFLKFFKCLGGILCQETVPDGLVQTLLEQAVDVPHGFLTQSKTASSVIAEALPFLQKFSDHL